jgi:hypothetical protein
MITSADLTDAEWGSLMELRSGPLKRKIPLAHQIKFISLGLAKRIFEGLVATDAGRRYRREGNAGKRIGHRSGNPPPSLHLVT